MAALLRAFNDAADLGAVGEANIGAGGVAGEVGDEGSGELVGIGDEDVTKSAGAGEGATIGQLAAGIDFGAELVGDTPWGLALFGWLVALAVGAVAISQAADGIEGFEGEACGVDLRVAGGAVGVGAMFVELFAHGGGAASVGIDSADAGPRHQ